MPVQPNMKGGHHRHIPLAQAQSALGRVEIFPEYRDGLKDLEGFERILLVFHFNRIKEEKLMVHPHLDKKSCRGVFATRAPFRPNRIGISSVKLVKIENNILHIEQVDILNGTPLLDIKPYIPQIDSFENIKTGWIEKTGFFDEKQ